MAGNRVNLNFESEEIKEAYAVANEKGGIDIELKFSRDLSVVEKLSLRSCIAEAFIKNNVIEHFADKFNLNLDYINIKEIE